MVSSIGRKVAPSSPPRLLVRYLGPIRSGFPGGDVGLYEAEYDVSTDGGCTESFDCSHDELTPFGDGHQIPSWHREEVMRWLRSL